MVGHGPVAAEQLFADLPPERHVGVAELAAAVGGSRTLVILDDDPTGSQGVVDLPVLTTWSVDDVRWALGQEAAGFFVLTNTRSLAPDVAAARLRAVTSAVTAAAGLEGVDVALMSRGDSTLRGHFPLETDVLCARLARRGVAVDGVVVVPAYVDAGRVTLGSVHHLRTAEGWIPVGESEFARDATFGYRSSDLRDWVAEKTGGLVPASAVRQITLDDLRTGGAARAVELLAGLRDAAVVVVDAVTDDDLAVLTLALVEAETAGSTFLYRSAPSFVRARTGQRSAPPVGDGRLEALRVPAEDDVRPAATGGLVVVGSHTALTTGQLQHLRDGGGVAEVVLDVPSLLDHRQPAEVARAVAGTAAGLRRGGDVVLATSRALVTGAGPDDSLDIARRVSAALVATVRDVVAQVRPAFVVAKGGITSSDVATEALGIRRAWARGTMLPGTVSVWEAVDGPARGVPYVVFPGNVGDTDALLAVVTRLRVA